jgi:hypothetical protein
LGTVESQPAQAAPGWHPDPWHRFEFRYFNGVQWTSDVSVNGQRYVDAPVQQRVAPTHPSRGLAITAFVSGLVGVVLGWVPFVFVVGGCGAIAAIAFGFLGVGAARRNDGYGRGFAIAGLALAPVAIATTVGGFIFTRSIVREFNDFVAPGPHELVEDQPCVVEGGRVTFHGTIHNLDDRAHDYRLFIEFSTVGAAPKTDAVLVRGVAADQTVEWKSSSVVLGESVDCSVTGVFGPLPFGFNPQS